MNPISNLDEYLQAEKKADELYEKPHRQQELNHLIEQMSEYEEAHPEEVSKIYGDDTHLPDADSPDEDWLEDYTTYPEEDY